jgi:hypothetical protein
MPPSGDDEIIPPGDRRVDTDRLYRFPSPPTNVAPVRKTSVRKMPASTVLGNSPLRTGRQLVHAASAQQSLTMQAHNERHVISIESSASFNYLKYAADGLTVLAALAYRHGRSRRWSAVASMNEHDWRAVAVPLLCSIESEILDQLLRGTQLVSSCTKEVKDIWTENGSKEAPVIYARSFCDIRTGRTLTIGELQDVIRRLRLYIKQNLTDAEVELVKAVDEAGARGTSKGRHIRQGRRHFFGEEQLAVEVHNRRSKIEVFCLQCEAQFESATPNHYFRMMHYIGYAMVFSARMEQHRSAHASTSWFMHLFLATCKAALPSTNEVWGFKDIALCYCVKEEEAAVGEALMTMLAGAWYAEGNGFGIHPPGLSVASSALGNRTTDQAKQLWNRCEAFRTNHTPFAENVALELDRIEAYPINTWQRVSGAAGQRRVKYTSALPMKKRRVLQRCTSNGMFWMISTKSCNR